MDKTQKHQAMIVDRSPLPTIPPPTLKVDGAEIVLLGIVAAGVAVYAPSREAATRAASEAEAGHIERTAKCNS